MSGLVHVEELRRFAVACMQKVGASRDTASQLADVLVAADIRGHYSHGLNRLEMYVNDCAEGRCLPNAVPIKLRETAATAWVDGCNALGPVVGNYCMKLAIQKAKSTGVGWVVAKGSNHYGIAGWYSMQALNSGLLGMSFTNTSPLMCPTRSKSAAIGTNPLSLAAPAKDGDSMILDMATTAVAVGKIEVQRRKGEPIPVGWARDKQGCPTTNAEEAFNAQKLEPLGGSELTSGYKGYGLGLLVEVFCGILSGSKFGPFIRHWMGHGSNDAADLGQCFVALDTDCFAPGFQDRMTTMLDHLRNMEPEDPAQPVMVAGDPEKCHMKKVEEQGGIIYNKNQLKAAEDWASRLGVKPLEVS